MQDRIHNATAIELLRATDLFRSLDSEAASRLARYVARRRFGADETIFHEGDPGDRLHVIDKGRVRIIIASADGREGTLAVLRGGDSFGELTLLDGAPHLATARTLEATETVTLERKAFDTLLDEDSAVRRAVLHSIAQQLRRLTSQVADLHFLDLRGRVIAALVRLARGTEASDHGAITLPPLSQSDLAAIAAGTRQRVNHILGGLERDALIERDGRRITVIDVERLAERTTW